MKNIDSSRIRKSIVLTKFEFELVLRTLFSDYELEVDTDEGELGITFGTYELEDGVSWYDEVIKRLSDWYDVTVTSIHIDEWDVTGFWITFKE